VIDYDILLCKIELKYLLDILPKLTEEDFFIVGTGVFTRGLTFARQVLHHLGRFISPKKKF
jgi:hypothetical protein